MKYGYCMNAEFVNGEQNSLKLLEYIMEAGYDYIETPLSAIAGFEAEKYLTFKKILSDSKIPCKANFLLFPHSMILSGDEFDVGAIKSHAEKVLALAEDFGSETVVFGNGGSRAVKEGMDRNRVYAHIVEIIKALDPICEKTGVEVVVEPLNFKETNMINSFMDGVNLIKDAGAKSIGVLCDWYHVCVNEQVANDIDDIIGHKKYLKHLHIAYPKGRIVPSLGDDMGEYADFAGVIKKVGYAGKISIEAGCPEITAQKIAEGLMVLKNLF